MKAEVPISLELVLVEELIGRGLMREIAVGVGVLANVGPFITDQRTLEIDDRAVKPNTKRCNDALKIGMIFRRGQRKER